VTSIDLDGAKHAALAYLEGREREVLDLTCALIAAPSPNLPGDETAPAAVVHESLRRYGLPEARVVAKEPRRPNVIISHSAGISTRNLSARRRRSGEPTPSHRHSTGTASTVSVRPI
jgi:hypothetical protein